MRIRTVAIIVAFVLLATACSSREETTPTATASPTEAADPSTDKLAQVIARGTLVLPLDPVYPPASFVVEGEERATETLCSRNLLTGPEVDGYDVAVGKLVADALGVEPCFVTPTWTEMIAGNWGDRWDLAFASIGITSDRMEALYFTQPYYATPERFYVKDDAPYRSMEDLDGASIGVCAGCFADLYLQKELNIPGAEVDYRVDGAEIVAYDVERSGIDDVGAGTLDAFLCQETVGNQAIAEGIPLRAIDPEAYEAFVGGAIDRSSGLSVAAFYDRVNELIQGFHADGTLGSLSTTFFGKDYAASAAPFDIAALEQEVT